MTDSSYYESLAKKRMGAGAIFLDGEGRLLIVKPVYRSGWLIPGGSVEANESPRQACAREVREELGIEAQIGRLLCIDYTCAQGGRPESLQFAFYGSALSPEQIEALCLPEGELSEYRFVRVEEAVTLLTPRLARRIPYCLAAIAGEGAVYLEDGQPVAP